MLTLTGSGVPNFGPQTVTNNSIITEEPDIDASPKISRDQMTVSEDSSETYTVTLPSQPSGEVTVSLFAFPRNGVRLSAYSLTFDQDDWDDPQTVRVTPSEDDNSIDAWVVIVNQIDGSHGNREATFLRILVEDQDTPLDISGGTSISYAENGTSSVATYSVTNAGGSTITWRLFGKNEHGQDADDFSISSDGVLTFNSPPDYEKPKDSNRDNVYNVMIEASSGSSTGVLLDVEITVTDVSPNVSVTPGTLSVDEDAGNAQLTVELSAEHSDTVTVEWETSDGTAVSGSDYTADSGMLSFSPGDTEKTISVAITDDSLDEGSETFTVTLSNPSNADLGVSASTVAIVDNDTVVSLTPPALSVNESAGSAQFMVSLGSAHTETVTVQWVTSDGTATAGEDYTAGGSTLSFAPNEMSKTISVAIEDDGIDEGNETFTVTLSNPSNAVLGAASTSTVTIKDDDTAGVTILPQVLSVGEGGSDTYDVVLQSQPTGDVKVTIEVDPSGSDVSVNKQSLTFNSMNWSSSQTVTVSAEEDEDTDPDPAVRLNHTSTGGGYDGVSVPSVAVTVAEDDTSLVQMTQTAVSLNEGRSAQLTVRLSPSHSDTVTVDWETSSGTAGTDDYTEDSGTLSFSPGDTEKTISVVTTDDSIDEGNERFTVRLTSATSARLGAARTSTVTITDDDTRGVTISPQVLSVEEGGSKTYDVVLESEPTGNVEVTIEIDPPGEGVSVNKPTLRFTPRNWNAEQTVTVSAEEDTDTEVDRATLRHTFSGGDYGDIAPQTVTVTVLEDDTSLVQMAQTAVSLNEGAGRVRLAVELSEAHPDDTVAVEWETSSGTADTDDYTEDSGTLSFSPGDTQKTISVAITDDSLDEVNETFTVTLSNPSNAVLGAAETTVTIIDNDTAGVTVTPQVLSVNEGDMAVYGVALNSEPEGNVRVSIEINPPGSDVSVDEEILTFTSGNWGESQEVEVMAEEDEDAVPDSVTLSHTSTGGGYDGISAPSVAVTVVEDDAAADSTLGGVPEEADPDELRALLSLYDSAGGGSWRASTNWRSARPLGTWHGVTVDAEGRVTELDLGRNGLSGAIPTSIADLTRLRRLYLEENDLTAVPLAQLQALAEAQDSVLEELSLWGNGLSGLENISDELGWRVDRAALRELYEGSGGSGWGNGNSWLSESDPFSFSTWYGFLQMTGAGS